MLDCDTRGIVYDLLLSI